MYTLSVYPCTVQVHSPFVFKVIQELQFSHNIFYFTAPAMRRQVYMVIHIKYYLRDSIVTHVNQSVPIS